MSCSATRQRQQYVLECAHRYLAAGGRLIPNHNLYRGRCTCRLREACTHPGKHPRIRGWSDRTGGAASADLAVVAGWIARWPWLNLGLATGQGLLALDLDPAPGGLRWLHAHHALLPPTARQRTGSGGLHLLYRVPEEYYIKTTGPTAHALAPGVDTRGDGGQIIVAPARNRAGPYRWLPGQAPWECPPALAPPALLALLVECGILVPWEARAVAVPTAPAAPVPRHARPPVDLLLDKYVGQAVPGTRNRCGFHLALQLRDNGYSLPEAAGVLRRYQQAVDCPADRYSVAEALGSLHSAYRAPARTPWTCRSMNAERGTRNAG
jgi:hypothetical protein